MSGSLTNFRPSMREAIATVGAVEAWLQSVDPCSDIMPVGSVRRRLVNIAATNGDDTVGDIDIVACGEKDNYLLTQAVGNVFGFNSTGTPKTSGIIGRTQVDIFWAEKDSLGATELFYTLPLALQIALRIIAHSRAYKFGPKGLYKNDELVKTRSTDEVYEHLRVERFNYYDMENVVGYKPSSKRDMDIFESIQKELENV